MKNTWIIVIVAATMLAACEGQASRARPVEAAPQHMSTTTTREKFMEEAHRYGQMLDRRDLHRCIERFDAGHGSAKPVADAWATAELTRSVRANDALQDILSTSDSVLIMATADLRAAREHVESALNGGC